MKSIRLNERPVSVVDRMIRSGELEDPYSGIREYEAAELINREGHVFEYSCVLGEEELSAKHLVLRVSGVDTVSDVYLNKDKILHTRDMFRTYEVDIKQNAVKGENKIRFEIEPPRRVIRNARPEPGKEIEYEPVGCEAKNQYIRKAHSMFGWDWGIDLPDSGIYGDVVIEAYDSRIEDVWIRQEHSAEGADLKLSVELTDGKEEEIGIEIRDPQSRIIYSGPFQSSIRITEPQLWWPNRLGGQPLYKIDIKYKNEIRSYHIGLRTLTVSTEKTEWGSEFCFKVNGVKFFAMGADYIPDDAIYPRITDERLESMVKTACDSNFNMLRIWGGGYYPKDAFYDACDRYGIVVWQDFMFACNVYELSPDFEEDVRAEAADQIRRLRHHASLGLWCGNNEVESGIDHWDIFRDCPEALKQDYRKLFEEILPEAVEQYDGDHFYWPSSPSSGGGFRDPDSEDEGDTHYWAVWHGQLPFTDYLKHKFNFCSEFGFQSFPSVKTIETFAEEKDKNIFSRVMESHQKNPSANGKLLYYISENFRYPKNFDSVVYVTQILQGIAVKAGVEHFRRHRGKCMGALYWQMNDNWPVASWASIDYFGRWKALQYMAVDFFAPTAGSLLIENGEAQAWIANETAQTVKVKAEIRIRRFDFSVVSETAAEAEIRPFTSEKIAVLSASESYDTFIEAVFTGQDGKSRTETALTVPYKYLELPEPKLRIERRNGEITVGAESFAPFICLDFADGDAVFERNYFAVTSPEPVTVGYRLTNGTDRELTIKSLRDSYS